MPSYDMSKSPNYIANITGWTDAESYTENATSIDFFHQAIHYAGTYDYTLALEWWDAKNGYWKAVELQDGYMAYKVTKYFYLAGKPAGSYRMTGYYTPEGGSTTYINRTPAFIVKR
jgi:hypothetical protein